MRELFEETGISECHILDSTFDEFSEKGFPSVRYFVGTIENEVPLIFDNKELKSCSFINFETRVLPKRRQEILDKVINLKKSHL